MQFLCRTVGCARYCGEQGGVCPRCVDHNAPAPTADRTLLACTVCGYEAANRGVLALHVRREHADAE
jgi:hypothetical protein